MSVPGESTTVAGLARQLGVSFDPSTDDFWVTALANHEQRLEQGRADRLLVNRTSALWAAMALDPQVSLAVSEGRLVRQRFAVVSKIDDTVRLPDRPPESETSVASDVGLDTTLVEALTTYAAQRPTSQQPLTVPEIALAVLRSASGTTGLLSSRLREAGPDVPATIDALTRLVAGTGVYGFSASVRAIRTRTGAETEVSATLFARAIYDQEPYSGAEVATALNALARDTGAVDTVDGWLRRVRELYDANPRTIRLFVNAMSLQIAVRVIESRPLNLDRLALWVTLERRWPDLAAHLRLHPEDADRLVAEDQPARTPTEGAPPEQRLPEQAQQAKVSEMTEELAAVAPSEARAVMRHPRWGPLDTPAVRDCVGARADAEPAGQATGQEATP